MGDLKGTAGVVCQVCGKSWPADTSICPNDGTWLHDETIMDEKGRRLRARGDAYPPESSDRWRRPSGPLAEQLAPGGELVPGARVGDYDIEMKVGEGAMGTVYRAVQPAIGRRVAIKVMTPKVFDAPDSEKRFVAEARAVAAIRHPGIVDIFGFGRLPDERTYLVMEWLEGSTLGAMLAQGPLPHEEACDLLRQIARALEAAHSKGIIHRDLKPENVFIHHIDGEKPVTKLLDFGLAKVTKDEDRLVARTRTGQMLGTPLYMSPEQCKSKGVDHRTDIYALGCMSYELLAGRVPFDADNVAELISAHLMTEPPRAQRFNPRLPDDLDELLFQMIAKDPDQRPTLQQVRRTISQSLSWPSTPMPAVTPSELTPAPWAVPPGVLPAAPWTPSTPFPALAPPVAQPPVPVTPVAPPSGFPWLVVIAASVLVAIAVALVVVFVY